MKKRSSLGDQMGAESMCRRISIRNPTDGKIIGVVNFFRDLTEHKAQEAEREHLLQEASGALC